MPFVILAIGAVLLVVAYNNTQGDLGTALKSDVPGYLKWALALAAVGALQWVPGMRTVARWLLGLVLVVIVLMNYKNILSGVQSLTSATSATGTPATTPAQAYLTNPSSPNVTTADVTGTSGNVNANSATATVSSMFGLSDPSAFLAQYEAGLGGFGGVA